MSQTPPGRFVFANLAHPKRMAKLLSKHYPEYALSACQETLANMCGHPDWHSLTQAAGKEPPSLFDEDVPESLRQTRRQTQWRVLEEHLPWKPDEPWPGPEESDEEKLGHQGLRHARWAWHRALPLNEERALAVVRELVPTARVRPEGRWIGSKPEATFFTRHDYLPLGLGAWFSKHIPQQTEVADTLLGWDLEAPSALGLLEFLQYWGELCFYYDISIPRTIQLYGLLGCAWPLCLLEEDHAKPGATPDEGPVIASLHKLQWRHETLERFLRVQVRRDLTDAFKEDPFRCNDASAKGAQIVEKLLFARTPSPLPPPAEYRATALRGLHRHPA